MNHTASSARRLVAAMVVLVVVDLVGGLLAVGSGVNTWGEAWGSAALLAAPVPMVLLQVVLCLVATRGRRRRPAVAAAAVLALACLVSVVSGFFDGGLGNAELTGGLVAYQAFLLTVTAVVGGLAAAHAAGLVRAGRASRPAEAS